MVCAPVTSMNETKTIIENGMCSCDKHEWDKSQYGKWNVLLWQALMRGKPILKKRWGGGVAERVSWSVFTTSNHATKTPRVTQGSGVQIRLAADSNRRPPIPVDYWKRSALAPFMGCSSTVSTECTRKIRTAACIELARPIAEEEESRRQLCDGFGCLKSHLVFLGFYHEFLCQ